ncbi:MAG: hypothetical protein ACYTGC_04690, partial [Planctomycetota bacterium]
MNIRPCLALALAVLLPPASVSAQGLRTLGRAVSPPPQEAPAETPAAEEPRAIQAADYGRWESLGSSVLSPDGRWLAYTVGRTNGDDELRLRMLATDSTEVFEFGSRPAFSDDGKWLAFRIGVSEAEQEKARKDGKPVRTKLALHGLVDGETVEIEDVASFGFSDDGGFLVMRRSKPRDQKHDGVSIVVRDLASGIDTGFGNVARDAWNDDGTMLAMIIDAEGGIGNGIQVYDAATGRLQTLDSSTTSYPTMAWREDHPDLAALRQTEHDAEKDEEPSHVVVAWRELDRDEPRRREYDHAEDEAFPADMRIVDFADVRWSDDGETIFFGIKRWERKPADDEPDGDEAGNEDAEDPETPDRPRGRKKPDGKDEDGPLRDTLKDPSNVEVWHARDIDIIPRQKRTADRDRRERHLCAWWPESGTFVRLGNELTERVGLMEGQKRAIGRDNTPHEQKRMFGPTLNDLYVIDTATGERRRILEGVKYQYQSCPDGRYLVYVRDGQIWTYDLDNNTHVNLTGDIDTHFVNQEVSSLTDEKPIYGIADWTEDGRHLLLYDRYDIWMISADGREATRLTRGAEERIRHRRVVLDPDEEEFVDPEAPMMLSLYGDLTKESGYARLRLGDPVE